MAINIPRFGLIVLSVAGGATAGVIGKKVYDACKAPMDTSNRRHPYNVHNAIYSREYEIVPSQYHNRFMGAFKYVDQYRSKAGGLDPDHVLLSPLWLLDNNEVAVLLAAAIASQHAFMDYGELFADEKLQWNASQMRFVTLSDLMDNKTDFDGVSYSKDLYEGMATFILGAITNQREYRISRFIRDQAAVIEKLIV